MPAESGTKLEALLYRRLLDLSGPENVAQVLGSVMKLLARLVSAELAYLEAGRPGDWIRIVHSTAGEIREIREIREIEAIDALISREILRVAVARGEVISTGCASSDARFREHESMCCNRPPVVLCVPLKSIAGAIYLQGPERFSRSLASTRSCARAVSASSSCGDTLARIASRCTGRRGCSSGATSS